MGSIVRLVSEQDEIRLDSFIAENSELSRSRAQQLIRDGQVTLNQVAVTRPALLLAAGDAVEVMIPEARESAIEPENLPLTILYQDKDIAVIDKPAGMVVHPCPGTPDGTVVNALLYHLRDLSGIGGECRPGIVHRLDKDTSGLLIIAKNDQAHLALSAQFKDRTTEKHYRAVVYGCPSEEQGRVDLPIGRSKTDRKKMAVVPDGRPAATEWRVLKRLRQAALLDVHILTGRTHQIRVHMKAEGHPVLGDVIYAPNLKMPVRIPRLMLHAYSLRIAHPVTGEEMQFTAPLPELFEETVAKLEGNH